MLQRLLALLVFPATAVALVVGIAVLNRRAPLGAGQMRYPIESDALVLLAPSVLIYLLTLPFIWRRVSRAPVRSVVAFSSLAFALTVVGLLLLIGPLYHALSPRYPVLADRAFFLVFPFVPVLVAIAISARLLRVRARPLAESPDA